MDPGVDSPERLGVVTDAANEGDGEALPVAEAGNLFGDHDDEAYMDLPNENATPQDGDLAMEVGMDLEGMEDDDVEADAEAMQIAADELGIEPPRNLTNIPVPSVDSIDEPDNPANSRFKHLRKGAEHVLEKRPHTVAYPNNAGVVYSTSGLTQNQCYEGQISKSSSNPYTPFTSKLDWEIAKWAKLRGPSSTAFTELMAIDGVQEGLNLSFKNTRELNKFIDGKLPGRPPFEHQEILVGGEVCDVYFRDIIACIHALFGDPDFAPYLVVAPERHYTDESKEERMYHDMHAGRWWWSTQQSVGPGATIVPVIISTDKTQLTLFRNKNAYPIYMTIGNIPKEIRRRPSMRAYVLLGYLPTTRLEYVSNHAQKRRMITNLYHACLGRILQPLVSAGKDGVLMSMANGNLHTGDCPRCQESRNHLENFDTNEIPPARDLNTIMTALKSIDHDPDTFLRTCSATRLKPVAHPFWENLPHVDIYRSITPDILHQLYQGVVKHLFSWVISACGAAEIDARCRRLPQNHNVRLFMKGITSLSRLTGQEHDQICRFLLGLIIDIRLPDSLSNVRLLRSVHAILDFLYFAQYPIHTSTTLELLEDSLMRFHDNKTIFCDLGIRENFNIPKLHFSTHYVELIKLFGTTDNFNTQYTERLHIDLAKDAYAATNRKDEFEQMTAWLDRKEKILRHAQYVEWRLAGSPLPELVDWIPPGLDMHRELYLSKFPTARARSFNQLERDYGATFFIIALRRFISLANNPSLATERQLDTSLWNVHFPFQALPVWHMIKFRRTDPVTGQLSTADSIHVRPARHDKQKSHMLPGRFDTALINDGRGKDYGVKGVLHSLFFSVPGTSNSAAAQDTGSGAYV
ncbi:hypothetical protein M378DRAFT_14733 [Amanita muscaria Koide BX008]|uniref:Uncharacterized protein n=1 Tax=Amanita muscaria (strain Koide BX008) TaxID=946122 RepID=A0A0C2WE24_AMAMK|nr:hypothetical protein M378DRAFT_14733 [Amanita muscaria Koide BX008]